MGDLSNRLTEIGGNNTVSQPNPPPGFNFTFPPGGNFTFPAGGGLNSSIPGFDPTPNKAFTEYFTDGGNITTLNYTLWSADIMNNATIADVMDIGSSLVCAEYI